MEYYKNCKQLPLKIFFKIANSGDIKLLLIEQTEDVDINLLEEAWRLILEEYGKIDLNPSINDTLEKSDLIFRYIAELCEVKAMLLYLIGAYKMEYVERLRDLGYSINMSSHKDMIISINKANSKNDGLKNRIRSLKKSIDAHVEGGEQDFDAVYVWLCVNLGFEPKEDMTVSRYLQYKKQIHERNKRDQKRKQSILA